MELNYIRKLAPNKWKPSHGIIKSVLEEGSFTWTAIFTFDDYSEIKTGPYICTATMTNLLQSCGWSVLKDEDENRIFAGSLLKVRFLVDEAEGKSDLEFHVDYDLVTTDNNPIEEQGKKFYAECERYSLDAVECTREDNLYEGESLRPFYNFIREGSIIHAPFLWKCSILSYGKVHTKRKDLSVFKIDQGYFSKQIVSSDKNISLDNNKVLLSHVIKYNGNGIEDDTFVPLKLYSRLDKPISAVTYAAMLIFGTIIHEGLESKMIENTDFREFIKRNLGFGDISAILSRVLESIDVKDGQVIWNVAFDQFTKLWSNQLLERSFIEFKNTEHLVEKGNLLWNIGVNPSRDSVIVSCNNLLQKDHKGFINTAPRFLYSTEQDVESNALIALSVCNACLIESTKTPSIRGLVMGLTVTSLHPGMMEGKAMNDKFNNTIIGFADLGFKDKAVLLHDNENIYISPTSWRNDNYAYCLFERYYPVDLPKMVDGIYLVKMQNPETFGFKFDAAFFDVKLQTFNSVLYHREYNFEDIVYASLTYKKIVTKRGGTFQISQDIGVPVMLSKATIIGEYGD